jgi:hypothetical protein
VTWDDVSAIALAATNFALWTIVLVRNLRVELDRDMRLRWLAVLFAAWTASAAYGVQALIHTHTQDLGDLRLLANAERGLMLVIGVALLAFRMRREP